MKYCIEGMKKSDVEGIISAFEKILTSNEMGEKEKEVIRDNYSKLKKIMNQMISNKVNTLFYHTGHLHDVNSKMFFVGIRIPKSEGISVASSYTEALNSLGSDFGHITELTIMKVWEHIGYDDLLVRGLTY